MLEGYKWIKTSHSKHSNAEDLKNKLKEECNEASSKNRIVILKDIGYTKFYGEDMEYFDIEVYEKKK